MYITGSSGVLCIIGGPALVTYVSRCSKCSPSSDVSVSSGVELYIHMVSRSPPGAG